MSDLFERTVEHLAGAPAGIKILANYLTSDLAGLIKSEAVKAWPKPAELAELIKMIDGGEVSSRGAKDILAVLTTTGGAPRAIAQARGLFQQSDEGELLKIVERVIAENSRQCGEFKAGNEKVLQFLVGEGMKLSRGSANPTLLVRLLRKQLADRI